MVLCPYKSPFSLFHADQPIDEDRTAARVHVQVKSRQVYPKFPNLNLLIWKNAHQLARIGDSTNSHELPALLLQKQARPGLHGRIGPPVTSPSKFSIVSTRHTLPPLARCRQLFLIRQQMAFCFLLYARVCEAVTHILTSETTFLAGLRCFYTYRVPGVIHNLVLEATTLRVRGLSH